MEKTTLLAAAALCIIVCQSPSYANVYSSSTSVDSMVTAKSLTCDFLSGYRDPVLTYFIADMEQIVFDEAGQTATLETGEQITGVKRFSHTQNKNSNSVTDKYNLDMDVYKYGVHVLRVSKFHFQHTYETESDGYYFILKGVPEFNQKKLLAYGIDIKHSDMTIEKTKGSNTRLSCVIAG